jgi:hypothetical protein
MTTGFAGAERPRAAPDAGATGEAAGVGETEAADGAAGRVVLVEEGALLLPQAALKSASSRRNVNCLCAALIAVFSRKE